MTAPARLREHLAAPSFSRQLELARRFRDHNDDVETQVRSALKTLARKIGFLEQQITELEYRINAHYTIVLVRMRHHALKRLRLPPHCRRQNPPRHHALPQTLGRLRDLRYHHEPANGAHRPRDPSAATPSRRRPHIAREHLGHRPDPPPAHRTRTRLQQRHRPPSPPLAHTELRLTSIGASAKPPPRPLSGYAGPIRGSGAANRRRIGAANRVDGATAASSVAAGAGGSSGTSKAGWQARGRSAGGC